MYGSNREMSFAWSVYELVILGNKPTRDRSNFREHVHAVRRDTEGGVRNDKKLPKVRYGVLILTPIASRELAHR